MEHTAANPMYMTWNWYYALLMVAEAAVMVPWVRAYRRFPRAMLVVLDGLITSEEARAHPLARHPIQTRMFVLWCAHSHWIMASRALAHLSLMFLPHHMAYTGSIAWLIITTIPLLWGGLYSERVTIEFAYDAGRINDVLRRILRKMPRHIES